MNDVNHLESNTKKKKIDGAIASLAFSTCTPSHRYNFQYLFFSFSLCSLNSKCNLKSIGLPLRLHNGTFVAKNTLVWGPPFHFLRLICLHTAFFAMYWRKLYTEFVVGTLSMNLFFSRLVYVCVCVCALVRGTVQFPSSSSHIIHLCAAWNSINASYYCP